MKTTIATLLTLIAINVQAQAPHQEMDAYINQVFHLTQGYIEKYGETGGHNYAMGFTSEYLDDNLVRTMIGLATTGNVRLARSWNRVNNGFQYSVVVSNKFIATVSYSPHNNGLIIIYDTLEK